MLSCSIWFSESSLWMSGGGGGGGGLESRCVSRVYSADDAVHGILTGCIQNTEKCEYSTTSN